MRTRRIYHTQIVCLLVFVGLERGYRAHTQNLDGRMASRLGQRAELRMLLMTTVIATMQGFQVEQLFSW